MSDNRMIGDQNMTLEVAVVRNESLAAQCVGGLNSRRRSGIDDAI